MQLAAATSLRPKPAARPFTASQRAGALRRRVRRRAALAPAAALSPDALGWALFFTPGAAALGYSLVKGKGNLRDGFSHLITDVSQVQAGLGTGG